MDKKKTNIYYLLLRRLGQLFNIVKLYTPDHPVTKEKSQEVFTLLNELIAKEQSLSFSEAGSVFLVNGVEIDVKDDHMIKIFVNNFHDLQLGTLKLEHGIRLEDFNTLMRALSRTEHLQGEKQIREYLEKKGAKHIVPLFASYKLVREDEKVINKEKIINIEELPFELINKFSENLNKGDVSKQLKKKDKIYRFLAHDPNFLSQYTFRATKENDKDAYKEFEQILMLIGDYLIDEISNATGCPIRTLHFHKFHCLPVISG